MNSTQNARRLLAALSLTLLTGTSFAQTWDLAGTGNTRGFHHPSARRNIIAHGYHLYATVVQQNGSVQIRRKVNSTVGNWSTVVSAVNTTSTGIGVIRPTTSVATCVTKAGYMHVTWGRYYYPSFFKQYYRCYKIGSGFTHAGQDISALVGAATTVRTDSMAIATGKNDEVYMTAPISGQSWRSQLLQSKFTGFPPAIPTTPQWFLRGGISGNANSSSNVRMAVDYAGRVQLSFYNNSGQGRYATRVFGAPSTWSTMVFVGNPISSPGHDESGYLATDHNNRTHILYRHMVSKVGSLVTYQLLYRQRISAGAWSTPIVVDTFTNVSAGSNNTRDGFALSSTTKGDRVFAIYRDYRCGRLMVKQKKFGASGFTILAELQPDSSIASDYYMPSVRNTLYPASNWMRQFLDISFRRKLAGTSTFRLYHERLDIGRMDVDKIGCAGLVGTPSMLYGGVPCSSGPHTIKFGLDNARPGATAYLLYTTNPTMNISFAGCWLYANNILAIRTVNSCRTAEAVFNLPGGCFGFTMFNQWAVSDSAATGGWALSNRGRISL